MECHFIHALSKVRWFQSRALHNHISRFKYSKAVLGSFQPNDRRLYHQNFLSHKCGRAPTLHLLSSPVLCANYTPISNPQQTRGIIISKVIEVFRNAEITSFVGFSKFILESTPVTAVRHFYEWSEDVTGLPWGANIVLCTCILQLVLNGPAHVLLAKWMTGKEKHMGDLIAVRSTLMRNPTKHNVSQYMKLDKELTVQYGCQKYKFFTTILYQMIHLTITSFGVRSIFMQNQPELLVASMPWGSLLYLPDPMFVLPILNVIMSLLMVEVAAWKKLQSEEGLKMTYRRANMLFKPEPLILLNVRRAVNIPLIIIYAICPTALNLHWFAMVAATINIQILLTHKSTRRALGIAPAYYETDKPYQDFFRHLKEDVTIIKRKT